MRVLVTRPAEDSERTAEALRLAGHEPLVAPLFVVQPLRHVIPDRVDAFIATSANALRHATLTSRHLGLPIYTVGDATAAAAKAAGFSVIHSASGDSADLANLVGTALKPGVRIGYLAGTLRQDEALQILSAHHKLQTLETYRTVAVDVLPEEISSNLKAARIDAALHFSPRSAKDFNSLIETAGLFADADRVLHVFISPAAEVTRFTRRIVVARPNLAAMIAALDDR